MLLYYTILYCNFLFIFTTLSDVSLKKGAKKIFSPPQGGKIFMYFDDHEYPKNDEGLRKVHKETWNKYYTCLKRIFTQVNPVKVMHSIALVALEGTSITYGEFQQSMDSSLDCQLCISPDEMFRSNLIEWYYKSSNNTDTNILVEPSKTIVISQKDWSLTLYTVKVGQSGEYSCRMGNMISGIHHLSVDVDTDTVRIVHTNSALNGPYESKEENLLPYNLKIYTLWSEWTACSICDMVGKRHRYGYCAIALLKDEGNMYDSHQNFATDASLAEFYDDTRNDSETTSKTNSQILETSNKVIDKDVLNHVKIILQIFNNTLPCKSQLVPTEIKNIIEIKNRTTEKMIGFCKVHDKRGNVLETADNNAGIYSMVQGIPPIVTTISRVTVYRKRGNNVTLVCPSVVNKESPLVWKKRNVTLNPHNTKRAKFVAEYLNFIKLEVNDSGTYSCWQHNETVGIIKLIITNEVQLEINEPAMVIGSMLIIIVFLIIFSRTIRSNYKHAIH